MATTTTVAVDPEVEYQVYEALPQRIRQAIRYGPYDYAVRDSLLRSRINSVWLSEKQQPVNNWD